MPLHEYKTQVLLLHSEQSTLDNLSSGFSDRYTVHCATSGSDALNTLGETPINVIVSAQDLPGMSGLEALREAKKRSPDTVGILLAGNADDGLEALVGDKEVFQVVRGNVTGDMIAKLVDDATRQMRLMALAESANDTAANVDEPSEHIVMETSENGATIISDGTGQMPKLDPKKVSAAAAVGARSVDVLVLTKDQEFLATIKDSARGIHNIHYATTLAQADDSIRKHKVGVAVVDAAMVGDKVEQLTQHLRKGSARLVSIVAGRRDDGEMLMDLINRGKVYRFLLKPVSPGRARLAVEASVKHHLEAPDSAFKAKGPAGTSETAARPALKAAPKPQSGKAKVEKQRPDAPKKRTKVASKAPADPPLGSPQPANGDSPVGDGLDAAFGGDTSFTETVTGLISTVGKKFSGDDTKIPGDDKKPEAPAVPSATSGGDESPFRNAKVLAAAAAAVVILVGGLFWFLGGSDEPAVVENAPVVSEPAVTAADDEFSEPASTETGIDFDAMLEEARLARDAGQIFNPAGSNAVELYAAATRAYPDNAELTAEFEAIIGETLGLAETALLETRLDDAEAALQRIRSVDPGNARLPFLTAQLTQMQLRAHVVDARAAILEERFEDAANSLAAARSLGVPDDAEIATVEAELGVARNSRQAGEVLALANARLEEGDLLTPANDNARYYYELVLTTDPGNTAARQGLTVVANTLVLQARSQIDSGNFNEAQNLLDDIRAIDPSNTELVAAEAALVNARNAIAERQRQAEAERQREIERQAEAERIAEAERQAAEARAAAERAAAEQAAAEAAAAAAVAEQTSDETSTGPGAGVAGGAAAASAPSNDNVVQGPRTSAPATDSAGTAEPPVANTSAQATPPAQAAPVPVSSLRRIKYVAPKYPRAAERRNQSGWVDVVFIVAMDGSVKDIEIRGSEPGQTFVNAAVRAVEKWEFEPIVENGRTVEKRAGVRMMFALE